MKVKDLMIRDITAVFAEQRVKDVIKICAKQLFTGLPVVDEEMKVIGFISESDIISGAVPSYYSMLQSASFIPDTNQFKRNLNKIKEKPVSEFMTKPRVVKEMDSAIYAADLLIRNGWRVLSVVDEEEKLVGVVTRMRLLWGIINSPNI
ncbi:MAG TPA: CBS domain-containing protein [Thermotogaceae bacterium]|nr:CBS domain-containing protein [Thermotogota bacterium]HEW92180.1 CBS domain-containing protein [Thermotogaceae bacterium]